MEAEGNTNGLSGEQRRILKLVNDAIENQTFVLLFQPIISLRGDSDEHYEVFLRLLDEKGRRLPPDQFLELAIENGVAGKIDRWVILQSIKVLSLHRSKGHNTRLTINLTRNSLIDDEFIQWLAVAIKAARLPSDAVIFQIAEPDAASYVRQAREFVQGLKAMHCRTSLRHFGVTENAFETLRHVPVDFVKLDGNHVQELDGNAAKKDALTNMIRELQQHGKLTVIPMVESATVLSALWQAGANYIQGHYLQEPSTEMNYDFAADD
jgi:EAL domain-containing protein (putative c-di-GMP-specific phosphodiesterase class I)